MRTLVRSAAAVVATAVACILLSPASAQTNDAQYVGDTIPATMVPSYSYNVSVTMRNTGTTTWTRAANYRLGAVGDSDPFAPGRIDLASGDAIAPGQQKTFSFTMTAGAAGVRTTDWRMVQDGVEWFGETLTKQVDVTFGPNPPGTPIITWPTHGMILGSNRPDITFQGDPFDGYEIHVGSHNTPASSDGWDSGEVTLSGAATGASITTGPLPVQATFYVFVRLHNTNGWGPWSAYGNSFYVAGQLLNDPYVVASSGLEWWQRVAHNPERNEYCITWNNNYVIHWRRLDGTGAVIGNDMVLTDDSAGHHYSTLAYNPAADEYLMEYVVWMPGDYNQVRTLRIDANTGNQIGSPIWLYTAPGGISTTGGIRVEYSPTSNRYLAVWESYCEGGIIYGRLLDGTGNPVGPTFRISTTEQLYSRTPRLAYNSTNDEFLVTYMGYIADPSWDYWAQRIRASDGAVVGPNLQITTLHDVGNGDVAYDPIMNRYLVVYEAGGNSPWGQFVSSTPSLVGSRFAIGGGDSIGWGPSACWDPSKREFLVTWSASLSYANFSRRVSETGACIGETLRNNGDWLGIGNWPPQATYNSVNDEFLIDWWNSYATILVRRYKSSPLPTPDTTPPGPVTGFGAEPGPGQVTLTWTAPSDSDYSGTMVRYRTDRYPTSIADGVLVCSRGTFPGTADSYVHAGLAGGVTYYYSAFAYDEVPNYAPRATALATPGGAGTVGPVIGFAATAANMQVDLSWRNPSIGSFAGTMIRYKTTGYPTGIADGTLLVNKPGTPDANDSYVHVCLSNDGTTYYYSAFAYDHVPSYSAKSDASATISGFFCFSDRFEYANGNLKGSGCWGGSSGSEIQVVDQTVRVSGGSPTTEAVRSVSCSGGIIELRARIKAGSGGTTLWGLWVDDTAGNNLARWYGTGTTARPRIGGTSSVLPPVTLTGGWDFLDVRINTVTNVDEFFFNGVSLGTLNHTSTGAGDVVGRVRLERIYNSPSGDFVYLDDISVGPNDTTPPGPVTDFMAASADGAIELSWTNPPDADFLGTKIVCKTTGYPTGPTDGTTVCDRRAAAGSSDSYTHPGLVNGTRHYYAAFAYDGFPQYSSAATTQSTPAAGVGTIAQAKALGDGEKRLLRGKIVSATYSGFFYVQEPNRSAGLKVISSDTVSIGDVVDVVGTMGGAGGERFIDTGGDPVIIR